MNENLKNALIIIVVLTGIYYYFSPYQNCIRAIEDGKKDGVSWQATNAALYCGEKRAW